MRGKITISMVNCKIIECIDGCITIATYIESLSGTLYKEV